MTREKCKRILVQFLQFLAVSGVGWIIDFSVYSLLAYLTEIKVILANIISSIPAITYVFFISNKKIFEKSNSKLSLKVKYLIYFSYQIVLLLCVSSLGELIHAALSEVVVHDFLVKNLKLVVKILITPITMTINFIVMKKLIEKM